MNFRKLLALIIAVSSVMTLASCSLIRKIDKNASASDAAPESESYNTDFQSAPESETEDAGIIADEGAAYDFLMGSLTEEDKELTTVTKTGDMTAQSNGSEYYIFDAEKVTKTEDSDEDGDEPETTESEKFTYYVSKNGIIYKELDEANITVNQAKDAFTKKYGEKDPDTSLAYSLEYAGVIKNKDVYCYNLAVYLVKDDGSKEHTTNYIVTLDGRSSALQLIEN